MTPTEFVDGLAEIMGVERTELATVDRALAKRGLRKIARGKFRPDITLMEGLQVAFAWAGAQNLTLAADEVDRLRRFVLHREDRREVVYPEAISVLGIDPYELAGSSFLEVLAIVAKNLAAGRYDPKELWVSVEKHGSVNLNYRRERGRVHHRFFEATKFEFRGGRNVKVTTAISGTVLKWIFEVTEGA